VQAALAAHAGSDNEKALRALNEALSYLGRLGPMASRIELGCRNAFSAYRPHSTAVSWPAATQSPTGTAIVRFEAN